MSFDGPYNLSSYSNSSYTFTSGAANNKLRPPGTAYRADLVMQVGMRLTSLT